jgi:ectoine hydroxylase-related dioxygenase (phytanoyl-CoA dioxygenase family)
MPLKLPRNMQSLPASSGADAIFAAFKQDGIVIIKDFLSASQVQRFLNEVHPELEKIVLRSASDASTAEEKLMLELSGEKTKRLGSLVQRSAIFRHDLLEHDLMHALLERVFVADPTDGYWMNASEVIEITPGAKAQPIHRDQELYPIWHQAGDAMPEAICNFLSALTPFTAINGATQAALGTHLDNSASEHLLSADAGARAAGLRTVPAVMDPGDCIFFSGKILHGGGANGTAGESRRGLAMSFVRNMLTPEIAHVLTVPRDMAETMTYRGQAMLGFRSRWPVSEQMPNFYWAQHGTDIGWHIGLKTKGPLNGMA